MEYRVRAILPGETKETTKYFDGYDPATGRLIDAKRWENFPPDFLMDQEVRKIRDDAELTAAANHRLELRMFSASEAARMNEALQEARVPNVIVEQWPKQ